MKKWVALWIVFVLSASGLIWFSRHVEEGMDERRAVIENRNRIEHEAKIVATKHVETLAQKLAGLTSLEDLERFSAKDFADLSKEERNAVGPTLRAKLFEVYFRKAELLLARASGLLQKDENHPMGKAYIERAKKLYEKIDKLVDAGISARSKDPEENGRLNYMLGVYYYRSLVFIKDPKADASRVEELIGLSAKHLGAVFPYKPRNWDAEVAIEILQKKAQGLSAAAGDAAKLRLELLPASGQNRGPTFSIEGMEEGRR